VCYTETIYPPAPSLAGGLSAFIHKVYAVWGAGLLCRDLAVQRCYEETT